VNVIDLFNTVSSVVGNIIGILGIIISTLSFFKIRKIKKALDQYKKRLQLRDLYKQFYDQQESLKKQIQSLLKCAGSGKVPIKRLDFFSGLSILAGTLDGMLSNYAEIFESLDINHEQEERIRVFIRDTKGIDIDNPPSSSCRYIVELEYIRSIMCKERIIYDIY